MEFKTTKRYTDISGLTVTAKVMGEIIGVSERQIRNLASQGKIPKLENGSYELAPALRVYISQIKADNQQDKSELQQKESYNKEKTLHERAKRKRAELLLGQMRGELHREEVVEEVMTDMLAKLKSKFLALPTKIAPILLGRDHITEIQDILEKEIDQTLRILSDYSPELFIDESYIDLEEDEIEKLLASDDDE